MLFSRKASSEQTPVPEVDTKNVLVESREQDEEPVAGELFLDEAAAGGLGRHLGLTSTTFLIIGRIIGVGIFSTPSSITASTGSVGAAFIAWLIGFIMSFAGLMIWLELGCMIPRSGGEKVYLEAAYKRPKLLATVVFAVQIIILGFTAAGCIVFTEYVFEAAGHAATEWEKRGVAIAVVTVICSLHAFVPNFGVRFMNVIGVVKLGTLLFIIVAGWAVLAGGTRVRDPHASFRNSFAGTSSSGWEWANALFDVIDSYAGWSNAAYVLNEVRDPVRTLRIAAPLGLTVCGIFYMLANVSYYAAATPAEVRHSGQTVAKVFMQNVFGHAGVAAISALIALSAFGNVMSVTFAQARVNQELAKEGVIPFPKFWASNWPSRGPSAALLLHWIPSFIVIVAVPFGDAYDFILDLEGYPSSIINLFVVIGFFWLRYSQPRLPRPFRCWLPVAAFYGACQVFLIVTPWLKPPKSQGGYIQNGLPYWLYCAVGIAVLALAVVYWAVWTQLLPAIGGYSLKPEHQYLKDGTAVVVYKKVKKA